MNMEYLKLRFISGDKNNQGMDTTSLKRLKALEEENRKLKHMYADLALDHQLAKEIIMVNC